MHTYVCEERWLREKIGELKKYNKPIWLTEFSCGDLPAGQITLAVQKKYLTDAVNYLENEPAVFRYSWFAGRNNEIPNINLLGNSGQLTELGQLSVSLPGGGDVQPGRLIPVAATASSTQSTTNAANTTDRDLNSRWSSAWADPQYLQFDFGQTVNITRIRISWEAAYAQDYQLQTSADGTSWTTIHSVLNSDGGVDDITSLVGRGRYLRVYGTRWASAYGYSIYEMEVYGPAVVPLAARAAVTTELEVYPNPAANRLLLHSTRGLQNSEFQILDALGRLVARGSGAAGSVDVSELKPGIYSLRLSYDGKSSLSRRFAK